MPSRAAGARRRRPGPLAAAGLLLAVVVLLGFLPWLLRERPAVSSTPIVRPPSVIAELQLRPDEAACVSDVLLGPDAEEVAVEVTRTPRAAGPPLEVTARAPGFRAEGRAPGGYNRRTAVEIPIAPARRPVRGGRVCVRNAGRADVWFLGTVEERALSTQRTTIDGRPARVQLALTLQERENRGLAARTGQLLDRAATFRPGYLGPAVLWVLLGAVALGVPAAALLALRRAVDEDAHA